MPIKDLEILRLMELELKRQKSCLQMIPSENYASAEVLSASGSILSNKYAEGYPKKRYYQGTKYVDAIETLTIERAKKLFGAEHANVQPYSGSVANMAVYYALLKPGDSIMGMRLDMGGHLTHGHGVNFSSRYYQAVQYGVDQETELLDMDKIRALARQTKPQIIVSGATAYPRRLNFKEFHEIAEEVGAYSLADISHIAGLIVGKVHHSPFPFTDVVMTTTHKTLRGPRGAIILCKQKDRLADTQIASEKEREKAGDLAGKIDRAVFPGLQGGPHQNLIAAKAIALHEAAQKDFENYAQQVIRNARMLAQTLMEQGMKLVTNGTDNHLLLVDLWRTRDLEKAGLGKAAAQALEDAGIITNANTIPFDPASPFNPSGLRIGTPALTTRGMKEAEMKEIGLWISQILKNRDNQQLRDKIKEEVQDLCRRFPIYL